MIQLSILIRHLKKWNTNDMLKPTQIPILEIIYMIGLSHKNTFYENCGKWWIGGISPSD